MAAKALWRRVRAPVLCVLACGVVLSSLEWYNGFPLTYGDTSHYMRKAFAFTHGAKPLSLNIKDYAAFQPPVPRTYTDPFFLRPVGYTLLLVPFASAIGLFLLPLAQGVLVAAVLLWFLRRIGTRLKLRDFVVLIVGLTIFSALPWYVSEIMPDVLTGLVVMLAVGTSLYGAEMSLKESLIVGVITVGCLMSHLSHLPLYAGVAVVGLVCAGLARRQLAAVRRAAVVSLTPLVMAVLLLCTSNYIFRGGFVISPSSPLFYTARLVGDGTAQRYLAEECPVRHYLVCTDKARLRANADSFLWNPSGPYQTYQNDPRFMPEIREISRGTLRRYWPAEAVAAARDGVRQLVTFGVDPSFREAPFPPLRQLFAMFGPATDARFKASRQTRLELPVALGTRLQAVGLGISLVVLIGAGVVLATKGDKWLLASPLLLVFGIVLNAFVIGALTATHDRYQGRVMWLLPVAAVIALVSAIDLRQRAQAP